MDPTMLKLGTVVATAIYRLWTKDFSATDTTVDIFGQLISKKTEDHLAVRRGTRQFDRMAEDIAEQLDEEIIGLDEGARNSILTAATALFEGSDLSARALAKRNLEPSLLTNHLLSISRALTAGFSDDEVEVFRKLVFECSQRVVDIASQLPSFTEQTFGELLTRTDEITEVSTRILEEVKKINHESLLYGRDTEEARFESNYCLAVARLLDELVLFGVDVSESSRRHKLSVAYIGLSATSSKQTGAQAGGEDVNAAESSLTSKKSMRAGSDVLTIDQLLSHSPKYIIRGFAGSGKTTLLHWLAVNCARHTFEGTLGAWNVRVPFFVSLRQHVRNDVLNLPHPEDFPRLVAPMVAGSMPPGWVHRQLEAGRGLVLIDGVDEIPNRHREAVWKWIADLEAQYQDAAIIVTTRPHVAINERIVELGFDSADLLSMDTPQMYSLIDHWHEAVKLEVHGAEEKTNLELLAVNLKKTLRMNRSLRLLATSPLLCSMLCAIHRHRQRHLPSDRVELYEACCQMLIERREMEREIHYDDYPLLNYGQKSALLEEFAYWLVKNGQSQATMEDAVKCWEHRLSVMVVGGSGITVEGVKRLLLERTAIVREPLPGIVDFAHKSFQEFLAAKAAVDSRDMGLLADHARDDQWREVIILAAGLAPEKDRNSLISKIIARGDRIKRHRHKIHLLAMACLETSLSIDPRLRVEVEDRLSRLIPPKDDSEAMILASAGDLAVPYLRNSRVSLRGSENQEAAQATVRSLALIGGESALSTLEEFAQDKDLSIESELLRAWQIVDDKRDYGERILPLIFSNTEFAFVPFAPTLNGFERLQHLKRLEVGIPEVEEIDAIASMSNLEHLELQRASSVRDFSPIAAASNLRSLSIEGAFTDLSSIAELKSLRSLRLDVPSERSSLAFLGGMHWLENLELAVDEESLVSIDFRGLASLKHLAIYSFPWFRTRPRRRTSDSPQSRLESSEFASGFSAIANLESLYLHGEVVRFLRLISPTRNKLSSLKVVYSRHGVDLKEIVKFSGSLRSLTAIGIRGGLSTTPLSKLRALRELTLAIVGMSRVETDFLRELNTLQYLTLVQSIDDRDLANISTISRIKNLTLADRPFHSISRSFRLSVTIEPFEAYGTTDRAERTPWVAVRPTQSDDLSFLANARDLKSLTLIGFDDVTKIDTVFELPNLVRATFGGFPNLSAELGERLESLPNFEFLPSKASWKNGPEKGAFYSQVFYLVDSIANDTADERLGFGRPHASAVFSIDQH